MNMSSNPVPYMVTTHAISHNSEPLPMKTPQHIWHVDPNLLRAQLSAMHCWWHYNIVFNFLLAGHPGRV